MTAADERDYWRAQAWERSLRHSELQDQHRELLAAAKQVYAELDGVAAPTVARLADAIAKAEGGAP